MRQNYWNENPSSFAETVELVKNYAIGEIRQETKTKQLYYHTLDHSLAVQRRVKQIFQELKFVLSQSLSSQELERLKILADLCGLAHDMVQLFGLHSTVGKPRQHISGQSEIETADKLLQYIQGLNQHLATRQFSNSVLFSDRDCQIIKDAILATICQGDPQAGKAKYSFSTFSIYQPYLYDPQPKISIVGDIIALADLGALGMEGVESYIRDGILIFIEDNLDLKKLIFDGDRTNLDQMLVKIRLLAMARFIVSFAKERYARFELEISSFTPLARRILREKVFIYLNPKTIAKIEKIVPTDDSTSLPTLIDFFSLNKSDLFIDARQCSEATRLSGS